MRKIVQIVCDEDGNLTWALCDDGVILQNVWDQKFHWVIWNATIPQPDPRGPVSHKMVCAALYAKWREHPKDGWSAQSLRDMRVILEAAWAAEE